MRGDVTMIDNNPYSAPTEQPHLKRGMTHHDFELTENGIRCRTGLELPKICLVTGRTDNLVTHRIGLLWMSPFSKVILFGIPFFGVIFPIAFYFLNRSDSGRSQQQILSIKWLPIAWSSAFQFGILLTIWKSPRGVVTAMIQNSVRRRIRIRQWIAAFAGISGAVIGGMMIMSVIRGGDWNMALLVTSLIGLAIVIIALGGGWRPGRKPRLNLNGLKLKVIDYQSGQFEIAGFTEQFLTALRSHQRND